MKRNLRTVWLTGIGAVVLLILIYVAYDLFLRSGADICGDGRTRIDMRDFTTRYSAYAVEFEAALVDKGKVSGKLNPVTLQQVSESIQLLGELTKATVAGYNACAIGKVDYGRFLRRYQALDALARQINGLLGKDDLPEQEQIRLEELTQEFIAQCRKVGDG